MYTLSGEPPFKDSIRLAGVLQLPEVHKLHNQVIHEKDKQASVSWLKGGCQFHLVCKGKGGKVEWQLYQTKSLITSLIYQSFDHNLHNVFSQVSSKTDEVVEAEKKRRVGRITTPNKIEKPLSDTATPTTSSLRIQDQDWIASLLGQAPPNEADDARCSLIAQAFLQDSLTYLAGLIQIFNERLGGNEPLVTISDMGEVEEKDSFGELRMCSRWRVASSHWCLSARVEGNRFELYLVRSTDAYDLAAAETESSREFRLYCTASRSGVRWWHNGLPVTADELRFLLKSAFSKFAERTLSQSDQLKPEQRGRGDDVDMEKQALAQKVIAQQEQLQRRIARDLHDAVIADVTVLKRALKEQSDKPVATEEIISALESIATRIREICYDLAPADLRDWGLKTTLEALIDQTSTRTNARCVFDCDCDIPPLQGSIDLHIYRILQELLTNVIKYAQAGDIVLSVTEEGKDIVFTVKDNGRGIDPSAVGKQSREGGMGMSTIQERVGLIRVFYPAQISVKSEPGKGTIARLAISLS